MTISITRDQLRFTIDYGSVIVVDVLPAALYSRRHTHRSGARVRKK
jgi:hypothetical protein